MLDYTIWPWFERLPAFELKVGDILQGFKLLASVFNIFFRFIILKTDLSFFQRNWRDSMKADPHVKAYSISPEDHLAFIMGLVTKTQDYDLLHKRENKL